MRRPEQRRPLQETDDRQGAVPAGDHRLDDGLFSKPIDSLAASGAILAANWTDAKMPVVDSLGEEFLAYVKDGMKLTVGENGLVTAES